MYELDSLNFTINTLKSIYTTKQSLEFNKAELEKSIKDLEQSITENKEAKVYYSKAVDLLYAESIGALKNTLDTALKYVFYDRTLESDFVIKDERGNKTLEILLNDLDKELYGLEPIEDDGAGVATVFSAVVKFYLLLCNSSKVLFLDEKYSNVSREYTERFFDFLNQTCSSHNIVLAMISHDPRFSTYVDNVLQVQEGFIRNVKNEN